MKVQIAKVLVILGTILVLLPLVAPAVFGIRNLIYNGKFYFDFLMPGELFPLILTGGIIISISSFMTRYYRLGIFLSFGFVIFFFLSVLIIADITGLGSGKVGSNGWQMVLVSVCFGVYVLAVGMLGVCGILLFYRLIHLFRINKT